MTAHPVDRPVFPYAETGWSEARRKQDRGVRTCVPAIAERTGPQQRSGERDGNIVRGED
ncbi:hypothetical protein ACFQ9Z_32505 [Streptomyces sp. NPDC056580]|uniref:hypothetical protein n=1 Tax=Streptomyces sp. NPDC056580 TaxID=3345872 RepID=UPI00368E2056